MNVATATKYNFETGVYRPPSEGGSYSLLIRVTRNCPWNRCGFCSMYKGQKFKLRSQEEVKADIDSIAAICNNLKSLSLKLGYGGEINRNVVIALLETEPELNTSQGFVMVYNWLASGGKTAFLQDANSLILPAEKLADMLGPLDVESAAVGNRTLIVLVANPLDPSVSLSFANLRSYRAEGYCHPDALERSRENSAL